MTDVKKLIEKRKEIKKNKPDFAMQDSHKLTRLEKKWRKPRGIDSKMRLNLKGYNKKVQPGYGSPRKVMHLLLGGIKGVVVFRVEDIEKIDKSKEGAIISAMVGKKKRAAIIEKAKQLSIKIINIKNPEEYLKNIEKEIKERKERRKKRSAKKKAEKKEKKEDKLAEKVLSEEEKAEQEKKEKDKILTKKDNL